MTSLRKGVQAVLMVSEKVVFHCRNCPCRASFRAVSGGEMKHLLGVRYFCVALKLLGGACSDG